MKKVLAMLLASSMILSFAACGNNDTESTTTEPSEVIETTTGTGAETPANGIVAPSVEAGTVGETLWNAFLAEKSANAEISAEELANKLVTNEIIQFFGGAMPIEADAEYLPGFSGEKTVTGFTSAAQFGPMMGSIAFVGYVFELAEGADVNAFIATLEANADPRWNICVTADQTTIGAVGNTVFFLMSPAQFEVFGGEEDFGDEEGDVIIAPVDVEVDSFGDILWGAFFNEMILNPGMDTAELANTLVMNDCIQFMGGAMPIEADAEYLAGFDGEKTVTGFVSAAQFGPMMGSIPFVGYVFELAEDADVNAFIATLEANANPRWNICVTAEQTTIGAINNMVFFLMSPISTEG